MTQPGSTAQTLDTSWDRSLTAVRSPARQLVLASYERSAITLEEYAKLAVAYSETASEIARRKATRRRVDLVRDSWGPLLKARFKNWVTPEIYKAVVGEGEDHIDLSANPAKRIWQDLSVTYKRPPRRYTEKKTDGEKYVKLLEGTGFELFWATVELMLEACNEVLIWPDVVTVGDEKVIKHRYATGDVVTLIPLDEDPSIFEAVLIHQFYTDLAGVDHKRFVLWTYKWHATFERDKEGALNRTDLVNPELVADDPKDDESAMNPYGVMPQYLIRKTPWPDCLWDTTTGEDLVDAALCGGEGRLFYRYHEKVSGFKQGALTGSFDKPPQQLLDPGQLLTFDGQGTFTTIDWQLDLKSRQDCMMADELRAAASRGINPEFYKRTASWAKVAERGLSERRTRNSPIFKEAEKTYKRTFCIVAQKHGLKDPPSPDEDLIVEHAPLEYPEDPKSQLDVEKQEISMGLSSHIDAIQRRRPELKVKEAKKVLDNNLAITAEVNDMKTKHNVPDDPAKESKEAEENGLKGPAVRDDQPVPGSPPGDQMSER